MRIHPISSDEIAAFVALTPLPEPVAERLIYRSLPEVGTGALLIAIERVSVGTPDQIIQQHRTTYGAEGAAQLMLSILQNVDNEPMAKAFRRAGYTQAGTRREYQLKHTA